MSPSRSAFTIVSALLLAACSRVGGSSTPTPRRTNTASLVAAPDVYLQAQTFQIAAGTFGNASPITMWGYATCGAGFASCGAPSVPGPAITATEGGTIAIHIRNALTGPFVEPTSVVIHGQLASMSPVWIDPSSGSVTGLGGRPAADYHSRVRSFTTETPADAATEVVYTWTNVRAGTYLYESGTHPGVQVQMGLYGALEVLPAMGGRAYADPSTAYDSAVTLLYSEIDPVLHAAIAAGTYGPNPNAPAPAPAGWLTSTVGYRPQYFLVNGRPFDSSSAPIPAGAAGSRILMRLLNAGLQSKVPTLNGVGYMSVIAEDGNFYAVTNASGGVVSATRQQYSVFLPAGKTTDAILTPSGAGTIALYDRRLNLSNAGATPGGLLTILAVAP